MIEHYGVTTLSRKSCNNIIPKIYFNCCFTHMRDILEDLHRGLEPRVSPVTVSSESCGRWDEASRETRVRDGTVPGAPTSNTVIKACSTIGVAAYMHYGHMSSGTL